MPDLLDCGAYNDYTIAQFYSTELKVDKASNAYTVMIKSNGPTTNMCTGWVQIKKHASISVIYSVKPWNLRVQGFIIGSRPWNWKFRENFSEK